MLNKFLIMSPVVFLMSCASLSEEACKTGDWESIGYNDGVRGRSESYINEHREACGEFGITPNTSVWLRARAEGLKQYCTPTNAYNIGRRGNDLNPVCPAQGLSDLRLANFFGLRYYEIDQEIDALTDEKENIEFILATQFIEPLTPDQLSLKNLYLSQLIDLQKIISELKWELLKYDELP